MDDNYIRSLDKMPTDHNLKESLEEDTIGRDKYVLNFISLLTKIEGHYSIAIDGDWGSGKTFFVKEIRLLLKDKKEFYKINKKLKLKMNFPSINSYYYNAWENDNENDPLSSLIYQLMLESSTLRDIKIADVISLASKITEEASKLFFNLDFSNITKELIEFIKGQKELGVDKVNINAKLKNNITDFLNKISQDGKTVIFIDELDRCKPTYAVKLLERIKHYFTNDNIIYVFSINIEELKKTVKQYYGSEFDGERYLDRFFDSKIVLPLIDSDKYWYSSLNENKPDYGFYITCDQIIKHFNFTMREINHFRIGAEEIHNYNFLGHYDDRRIEILIKYYLAPIIFGIKMHSIDEYNKFISGNDIEEYEALIMRVRDQFLQDIDLFKKDETFSVFESRTEKKKKLNNGDDYIREIYRIIFPTEFPRVRSEAEKSTIKPVREAGTLKIPEDVRYELLRIVNFLDIDN